MASSMHRKLKQEVAPYERSDWRRSWRQIVNSIPPFILLWFLAYQSLAVSYGLTLALAVVASGFLVRIFILFHDCCHHSFFKHRAANVILGTLTGILTFHPYFKWKQEHAIHHATSGNLAKRGVGDIEIMTVDEYAKAPFWKRLGYRLYRNPLVMFGLGPFYTMLLENRFNRRKAPAGERWNTYLTNAAIAALVGGIAAIIGWKAFLMIHLPIFYLSGAAGIWLFYVQHQFEDSYFEREEDWDYVKAAVDGSSYYQLPKALQWLTGNIGFHHVHHLSPRIPNYYLEEAHARTPALQRVTTITLASSLQALRFRLWDEQGKRFVGFREARRRPLSQSAGNAGRRRAAN